VEEHATAHGFPAVNPSPSKAHTRHPLFAEPRGSRAICVRDGGGWVGVEDGHTTILLARVYATYEQVLCAGVCA
jgi:hypothetical protein